MITLPLRLTIIYLLLLNLVQSTPFTIITNPQIKTGQKTIVPIDSSTLMSDITSGSIREMIHKVTFDGSFTATPTVALGINQYQFDTSDFSFGSPIFMGLYGDQSVTTVSFGVLLRVTSSHPLLYISLMTVNYLAVNLNQSPEFLYIGRELVNLVATTTTKTISMTRSANGTNTAIMIPSIVGDFYTADGKAGAYVAVTQTSTSTCLISIDRSLVTQLFTLSLYVIVIDSNISSETLKSVVHGSQCFNGQDTGFLSTYLVASNRFFVGLFKYHFIQSSYPNVGFTMKFQSDGKLLKSPTFEQICINVLNLAAFVCDTGYIDMDSMSCLDPCPNSISLDQKYCAQCVDYCEICANTTDCDTCVDPRVYQAASQLCVCPVGYYESITQCQLCTDFSPTCLSCTVTGCQDCDVSKNFELLPDITTGKCFCSSGRQFGDSNNNTCVCSPKTYDDLGTCISCHVTCLECNGAGDTSCTSCDSLVFRESSGTQCGCKMHFVALCTTSNASCDAAICYIDPSIHIKMEIAQITKDPETNSLTFQLKISPDIEFFNEIDFNQVLNLGLPQGTMIDILPYDNGELTIKASYIQDLQNLVTQLQLPLSTLSQSFPSSTNIDIQYAVLPDNNLAANYYGPEDYNRSKQLAIANYALIGVSALVFILGMYSSKLIVSEMIGMIQVTYLGLFIISFNDPLMRSLNFLRFSHGFSDLIPKTQGNVPGRIYYTGTAESVFHNLNIVILISIIPLIISFVFYMMATFQRNHRSQRISKSKLFLGEYFMVAVLFFTYNISSSSVVFAKYSTSKSWVYIMSIAEIVVCYTMLVCNMLLYGLTDYNYFGEFKYMFKWKLFSLNFYYIHVGVRVGVGILVSLIGNYISGGIVTAVFLGMGVLILVMRPYADLNQSLRSATNYLAGAFIFAMFSVVSFRGQTNRTVFETWIPVIIIGLLFLLVAIAIGFIIRQWVMDYKVKEQYQQPINIIQEQQRKHQQFMRQQVQESIKHGSEINIARKMLLAKKKKPRKKKKMVGMEPVDQEQPNEEGDKGTNPETQKGDAEFQQEMNEMIGLNVEKVLLVDQMLRNGEI